MRQTCVIFLFAICLNYPAHGRDIVFSVEKIKVGLVILNVEIAKTPEEQEHGLMFRKKISDEQGMLFIYQEERELSFWMKNTFIPLSIGFFNKNRELIDVQEMSPVMSEMQQAIPSYRSRGKAMYALEVNQGWFKRHNIKSKAKLLYPVK